MIAEEKTVLFVVTFGAGLGHLVREIAIADELRKKDDSIEIIFYTTSPATQLLYERGFYYYYCPSYLSVPKKMNVPDWNDMFENQLVWILEYHKPRMIVYDGAYPQVGLIKKVVKQKDCQFIWVKREGDRKDIVSSSSFEKFFRHIIVPGEIGIKNRPCTEMCTVVNPIIYETEGKVDITKIFPEYEKSKHRLWYIQLGAGIINDIDEITKALIEQLLEQPNNYIIHAVSPVGKEKRYVYNYKRVKSIKEFPNSMYFPFLDYAISAAGYNSFYELLFYKVPSLYIPNMFTQKDDQEARASRAVQLGVADMARNRGELQEKIELLYKNGEKYREQCHKLHFMNGARQTANIICNRL